MKIYPHLFAKLFASPLMVRPAVREHFEHELLARMGVNTPKAYDDYDDRYDRRDRRRRYR